MKFELKNLSFLGICSIIVLSGILLSGCKWFSGNKKQELKVINVLDKNLYDDCHIKGSINVPFEDFEQYAKNLDKDTHVVVYCSNYMCTASGASARKLSEMGFKNVWAYEAGMAEWYQAGLPVEPKDICKQEYLKMQVAKPEHEDKSVKVISTQELKDKMQEMHLI